MVLKLGNWENRSEIPGKFWNLVLEKDGENQFDRSSEKWGSISYSEGGQKYPTYNKKKESWLDSYDSHRNCLLKHIIEGKLEGWIKVKGGQGRRRKQLLYYLKETTGHWKFKEEAVGCLLWRTRFGWGYGPVLRQTNEWINEWIIWLSKSAI